MSEFDLHWMQRAIDLAKLGQGCVEPNPMVGCVIVRDGQLLGEGYHQRFGGPHAEVVALNSVAGTSEGATAYVTLEPCAHHGKTPPCCDALIEAGVSKVVVSLEDPFPEVAGKGIKRLRDAKIDVEVGLLAEQAHSLNAPYLKRVRTGLPWMIAKYAMTLDGKIATASGDSKWISNEASREIVHRIRGRVDVVMVGANTAIADDPLLTARPPGRRSQRRVVLDSQLRISPESQLVRTAGELPLDIVASETCVASKRRELEKRGANVFCYTGSDRSKGLVLYLRNLVSEYQVTNVLVEGGGGLLGSFRDQDQIDELHLFLGPTLIGGKDSVSPIGGMGAETIAAGSSFRIESSQIVMGDVYVKAIRAR